jgi:hypothetical protein
VLSVIELTIADRAGVAWAQRQVTKHHYLHAPVDVRCRPLAYLVMVDGKRSGCLIYGRPESTACYDENSKLTYGSSDDVQAGKARYDRWELLNLARVWLRPSVQRGGWRYVPKLASAVIRMSLARVSYDYLCTYAPVDCTYPYQIRCVLSYCDTAKHSGWIYLASRFKLARTNERGIQTYMKPIAPLTPEQDATVRRRSEQDARAQRIRAERLPPQSAQLELAL